jgi:hypothetical protein
MWGWSAHARAEVPRRRWPRPTRGRRAAADDDLVAARAATATAAGGVRVAGKGTVVTAGAPTGGHDGARTQTPQNAGEPGTAGVRCCLGADPCWSAAIVSASTTAAQASDCFQQGSTERGGL